MHHNKKKSNFHTVHGRRCNHCSNVPNWPTNDYNMFSGWCEMTHDREFICRGAMGWDGTSPN